MADPSSANSSLPADLRGDAHHAMRLEHDTDHMHASPGLVAVEQESAHAARPSRSKRQAVKSGLKRALRSIMPGKSRSTPDAPVSVPPAPVTNSGTSLAQAIDGLRIAGGLPGGAAARAAAAAGNERITPGFDLMMRAGSKTDQESGIGMESRASHKDSISARHGDVSEDRLDPVLRLPAEILLQIFSLLDHSSLLRAGQLSRTWESVISSLQVWRQNFYREVFPFTASTDKAAVSKDRRGQDRDWKGTVRAWKLLQKRWESGMVRPICMLGHLDAIYCAAFDEDKIITASRDRSIRVWSTRTFRCLKVIGGNRGSRARITIGSFPQTTASANGLVTVHPSAEIMELESPRRERPTPEMLAAWPHPDPEHSASILCLQFDHELLVTGSSDTTLIMWSIKDDYKPFRRLFGHGGGVLDVCFDDIKIVSCSRDRTLRVWDRRTGDLVRPLVGHTGPVNAVKMRGQLAVSVSGDARIKLWDLEQGVFLRDLGRNHRGLACVQISEDSRRIVSAGNDNVVRLWDTDTGELLRQFEGHTRLPRSVCLDTQHNRVITASYDQSIKVFDLASGAPRLDFPRWASAWYLSARADYRRIVATTYDAKVMVFDFGADIEGIELLEGLGLSPQPGGSVGATD